MTFWNPVASLLICLIVYSAGEILSKKTRGAAPSLLFACFIFLLGFWGGLFPPDLTTRPGLTDLMAKFGIALIITNLGTMISLEDLCQEWKTLVIALVAVVGILLMCFTAGYFMFGREYALIAAAPIAGSTVAGILSINTAEAAGRADLAAFVVLILAVQKFFGIPISTFCIRRELKKKMERGDFSRDEAARAAFKLPSWRFIPETPKSWRSNNVYLTKLALVAALANLAGLATLLPGDGPPNYILNPNISCLLFGLVFARIGFL
ncbi:MAG: hypothetical protein LBS31_01120, partial [Candidatus Adiutrix sp.]|nr:hypothetical protein [Candidatus Adiutrix sp.]